MLAQILNNLNLMQSPVQNNADARTNPVSNQSETAVAGRPVQGQRGGMLPPEIDPIPPGTKSHGQIDHRGEEVGYVLEGSVRLQFGGQSYQPEVGDSLHFASQQPHGYENTGRHLDRIL